MWVPEQPRWPAVADIAVMDRSKRRSTRVTSTLTAPPPPRTSGARLDFEALYRAARDDVFAYVATLLHDRGAAEDVTAQAFERAFRKSKSYDARRGSERAWLFGIARNAALDELRKRKRTAELAAEPADVTHDTEEEADRALRRAAVRVAIAALEPRDRELIAL